MSKISVNSISARFLRCCKNPKILINFSQRQLHAYRSRNKNIVDKNTLRLLWYNEDPNLGDEISPFIVQQISGIKISHSYSYEKNKLLAVGSIIGCARNGDVVWGSGAIEPNIKFRERSFQVVAVRGPKTRKVLISQGISCPEIYGDPGILISDMCPEPDLSSRRYSLGIIPHYVDKKLFYGWNDPSVLILDIQSGREKFLHDLWQCQRVVSSSLHGIIFAEAYNIPAQWMVLSDGVYGGEFKFHDYYLGTERDPPQPLAIKDINVEKDWIVPSFDKEALLHSFPIDRLLTGSVLR